MNGVFAAELGDDIDAADEEEDDIVECEEDIDEDNAEVIGDKDESEIPSSRWTLSASSIVTNRTSSSKAVFCNDKSKSWSVLMDMGAGGPCHV